MFVCLGMSDLASPLLIIQNDEALAYICFCALMHRIKAKFCQHDQQIVLIQSMRQLFDLLVLTDFQLAEFLYSNQLSDLYFTHRWFLLELKREFSFAQSLFLFEIQWAMSDLIRLNCETDFKTSNSKSGGYLVLTESNSLVPNLEHLCGLTRPDQNDDFESLDKSINQWDKYTSRDVSLINSLIGSDHIVNLPPSKRRLSLLIKFKKASDHQISKDVDKSRHSNDQSGGNYSLSHDVANLKMQNPHSIVLLNHQNGFELGQNVFEYEEYDFENFNFTSPPIQPNPARLKDYNPKLASLKHMGFGNPFLVFLCLSLILEYRQEIMAGMKDPGDIIQFFQQKSMNHNLNRIVSRARKLFQRYLGQQNFCTFTD